MISRSSMGVKILNITAEQAAASLLAVPAFIPALVCTGYLVGWFTDLHGFKQRSVVERIFWSVPLLVSVTTISSILIGKFLSLNAVVVVLWVVTVGCAAVVCREWLKLRRAGRRLRVGWQPLGGWALLLAVLWIALVVASLVDIQSGQNLYASLTIFDHSMRVSWIEAVLRTGVPPINPLYMNQHPAPMRYYYFWYVLCADVVRMGHLSARSVMIGSCVWSGFALVSLAGLYTKHILEAGVRTRSQVMRVCGLLTVTGLGFLVNLWSIVHHTRQLPGDLEVWRAGQITSWFNSLLWDPHHVASMVCCMFGFLLAWMANKEREKSRSVSVILIAVAFASAFGLSIYVAFAFFLVMLAWAAWQMLVEKRLQPGIRLGIAGILAAILLLPYFKELTHGSSDVQGGSLFGLAVRETIPPEGLLGTESFVSLNAQHPTVAHNLANLILLVPGYAVELGFYCVVLLISLIPAWRGRTRLASGQRSLVCISVATLVLISILRSSVIESNDFGWRGALLVQFCLLLLAADVMAGWPTGQRKEPLSPKETRAVGGTPGWVRAVASYAIIFGALTTIYQAALVRFAVPLHELQLRAKHDGAAGRFPHKMYISAIGYAELDAAIPRDAVVQYNPSTPDSFWIDADWLGVAHQSVIDSDQGSCGSEFGGDPRGCKTMAAAIDAFYAGATAKQARAVCNLYGIDYLVSRIYDQAWGNSQSWVWNLPTGVSQDEFRAVDCR